MMVSYLTISDARALAATLPLMTAVLVQTDDALAAMLLLASIDVDAAGPFQGRKFDYQQAREFPRVAYGPPVTPLGLLVPGPAPLAPDTVVWDWDPQTSTAVVPDLVKIACLFQVAWLLQPEHAQRLERIRSGLAAQSTGGMSETYISPAALAAAGVTGLCDRASRMLQPYALKTGGLL